MDTIFGKKSLYAPESEIKFAQKTQKFIESGVENYFVKQKLTGDTAGDQFGKIVSMNSSGTILLMSSRLDDDGGTNAGAALIYTGSAINGWQLKQKLTGDSANDQFGVSAKMNNDGSVLMIGGNTDSGNGGGAGAAFVYTGNAINGWQLKQKLTGSAGDSMGASVAINNNANILAMSGPNNDEGGINAGVVALYTGNAINGWQLKQRIIGSVNSAEFGISMDMNESGSMLLIGRSRFLGGALIYTGDFSSQWVLKQTLTGSGSATSRYGESVATDANGSIIIMGGPFDDFNVDEGGVLIYTGNLINGWTFKQKLMGDSPFDQLGTSVDINSNGTTLIVGGVNDAPARGSASIYTGNINTTWQFKQKLTGNNDSADNFGSSVATNVDGTIVMVGGIKDSDGGTDAGAALVYTNKVLSPAPQIEIKFLKPQLILGIGYDDPNNALEPDVTAWVLMDGPLYNTESDENSGFIGGQSWRKMAPIGYLPYGKETYSYGDEQVRWNGAFWAYTNDLVGRTFAISYDDVQWPWLATWTNNFVGAKITSTYVKTTNYPAVP